MNKKWIFLILALVFIYAGNNLPVLRMGKIEPPSCKHCKVEFEGEHCPSCGKPIGLVGVFGYEGKQLHFSPVFESYADYATYMKWGKIRNILAVPAWIVGIVCLVLFFYHLYHDKHKTSQIV